jgi:hypothetical protein
MSARHLAGPPENKDHVSPPVIAGGVLGLLVAGLARALIDRYVDPADREQWWNLFQTVLVPALPAVGAWLGGLRARRDVTPVTIDATPRDLEGRELAARDHGPKGGYPLRPPRQDDLPSTGFP